MTDRSVGSLDGNSAKGPFSDAKCALLEFLLEGHRMTGLKPALLILVLCLAPSFANAACPVINGIFEMETEVGNKIQSIKLIMVTRQNAGKFSYTHDRKGTEFHPADGKPHATRDHDGRPVKLSIRCDGDAVSFLYVSDETGSKTNIHITVLNADELDVQSNLPARTGIYTRSSK